MDNKYQLKMLEISKILFLNNVPVDSAKIVGSFIEELIQENQSLKKQLKEKDDFTNKLQATKDRLNKYDYERTNQQKEFVEWLEAYIEDRDKVRKLHKEYSLSEERLSSQYFILQQVLSKYKEIIGGKE